MPKTKDAFALRGFDGNRILQRPIFGDCDLPAADDVVIYDTFNADIENIKDALKNQLRAERLNNKALRYLDMFERHRKRLNKFMATCGEVFIRTNDAAVKEKYQRAFDLYAVYFDLQNALEEFYHKIVAKIVLTTNLLFLSLCKGNFAESLRKAREAAGLSQFKLAQCVGLKSGTPISYYESGQKEPPLPTLIKLAAVLGTSPNNLLGWND